MDGGKRERSWEHLKDEARQEQEARKVIDEEIRQKKYSKPELPPLSIKSLWYGEQPLYKTFWLFYFLVNLLLNLFDHFVVSGKEHIFQEAGIYFGTFFLVRVLFFMVFYTVFTFVSVWRSALKYEGPVIWAILAQAAIVVWIIRGLNLLRNEWF